MHNGGVGGFATRFDKIRHLTSHAACQVIKGDTDSEHAFASFLSNLEPDGPWLRNHHTWISFNVALSTGTDFLALHFAHPPERKAPSLYWSSVGGSTLDRRYRQHPDGGKDLGDKPREEHVPHVVVANEPMTEQANDKWMLMKNGDLLISTTAELNLVQTQRKHQLKTHTLLPPKGWWKLRIERLFPAREPDFLSPLHSSCLHNLRLYPIARSNH